MKTRHHYRLNDRIRGFTLVELIVVITILVILSTIAFIQLGNFAGSARDSARVSDMNSIIQGLELTFVKSGSYPVPDASDKGVITITASGTPIGYQGYAGANVLSSIKMSDAKDPLDKKYYTYVTNANYSKYQILGLMEDSSTLALNDTFGINQVYAGYETRIPATKGSTLGILLENTGTMVNMPVQENYSASFSGVDIVNTSTGYTLFFDKDTRVSGTGIVLKSGIISTKGLVGYWDMETLSGTLLKDLSGNGNDGTLSGTTSTGGKVGNAMLVGNYKNITIKKPFINNPTQATFSFWVYPINNQSVTFFGFNQPIPWNPSYQRGMGFYYDYVAQGYGDGLSTANNSFHIYNAGNANNDVAQNLGCTTISQNTWNNITLVFNGANKTFATYVNGMSCGNVTSSAWDQIASWNSSTTNWVIGDTVYVRPVASDTYMDEVRIYNRALSDSEIQTLYNATK